MANIEATNSIIIGKDIEVTVDDFKSQFARDFPYLPLYEEGKAYFKNDVVYVEPNFYISLLDGNITAPPEPEYWKLTKDSTDNYISDTDIERAFKEAQGTFNISLFNVVPMAKMYFCYVAAHYLVIDLNNAQNPFATNFAGFTQSKSVGSVSESYGIPQWMLNDPILGLLAQTGYGRKYLLHIYPIMRANTLILSPGRTTYG